MSKVQDLLTPKQAARALGVSESSVKRWCDKGIIPFIPTPGGHRRITRSDFLAYLRRSGRDLVEPAAVGMPSVPGRGARGLEHAVEQFRQSLLGGQHAVARQIVFDLFLGGRTIGAICDLVIAPSFEAIGDMWSCGEAEVYEERRACEICVRILHELRQAVADPGPNMPLALGAAPAGDHYSLPTTVAELVLRESRWRATSLGSNLPLATLLAAVQEHRPRLFWLAVSHVADETAFVADVLAFAENKPPEVALVVGGRALTDSLRRQLTYTAHCDTMRQLAEFAGLLHPGDAASDWKDT